MLSTVFDGALSSLPIIVDKCKCTYMSQIFIFYRICRCNDYYDYRHDYTTDFEYICQFFSAMQNSKIK